MKGEYFIVRHGGYDFDVIVTIGMTLRDVQALVKTLGRELREIEHRAIYDDEEERGTLRGRTVHCDSGLTVLMLARLPKRATEAEAFGVFVLKTTVVWQDDELQRSGRTTRMLRAARNFADDGGTAIVVGASKGHVDELTNAMRRVCAGRISQGVHFCFLGEPHQFTINPHIKRLLWFVDSYAQEMAAASLIVKAGR